MDSFCNIVHNKDADEDSFDSFNIFVAIDGHEYGLKKVKNKDGSVSFALFNPHYQGMPKKVDDLKELFKKCTRIDFAQKSNVK